MSRKLLTQFEFCKKPLNNVLPLQSNYVSTMIYKCYFRNFRQTAELSLHISASETDIEKRIREVLDKFLDYLKF